jgi:hypothetical protein
MAARKNNNNNNNNNNNDDNNDIGHDDDGARDVRKRSPDADAAANDGRKRSAGDNAMLLKSADKQTVDSRRDSLSA